MSLRINTNVDALNAYRNLSTTQNSMSTSLQRLSSGLRINKAADDAAGLAISQGLQSQIGGITVALRNTQDGINVVQTADGALNETQSILQRMRDLAVQSSNDSNDATSRADIQSEVTQLNAELTRIAGTTKFNGVSLLDGTFSGKQFQVGYAKDDVIAVDIQSAGTKPATLTFTAAKGVIGTAGTATFTQGGVSVTTASLGVTTSATQTASELNADKNFATAFSATVDQQGQLVVTSKTGLTGATDTVGVSGALLTANGTAAAPAAGSGGFGSSDLGVAGVDMTSQSGAETAIQTISDAIQKVSTARANLGALQNRFQHTINNLSVTQQNLQASNSAITDTDMAQEMTNFTRAQVLSQAGTAMLAQANQASQSVLKLLQ